MGKLRTGDSSKERSSAVAPREPPINKKRTKNKKVTYEEAKQVFNQIQQQKREEKQKRREEIAKKREKIEEYNTSKKKMNRALKKRNKKGQPNLNAQIEVMLEKIQKKMK